MLLILWICLLSSIPASLQAQDAAWRRAHDQGDRYEGIVEVPNGKRDYEILGLFAEREVDAYPPDGQLHLMFYVPPGAGISSVSVKEIHNDLQYVAEFKPERLDDRQHWKSVKDWPVAAVIKPQHVKLSNLGVMVRLNGDVIPGQIAPAVFYSSSKPAKLTDYTLYFVSHQPLRRIACLVSQDNFKERCEINSSQSGQVETSEPAKVTFPAQGLHDGLTTVQLSGSIANTDSTGNFSALVHFVHHELPPE